MSQIYINPSIALGLPLDITDPTEVTGATPNALVIGAATSALVSLAVANNGELPIGSTGAAPVLATLTAGTNINITNGAGSITIDVAGSVGPSFEDNVFRVVDDGDNTRELAFECDQITTGTVREITMCDQDLSLINPSFPGNVTCGTSLTVTTGDSSILAGNFNMPITNAAFTEGVWRVGGQLFMHNLGTRNTFFGDTAGSLLNLGEDNTSLGYSSLTDINNGNYNVAIGSYAGSNITDGSLNACIGPLSLSSITTGNLNIALGSSSGSNYTSSESSNICIHNDGVVGEDNTIRIGTQGSGAGEQDSCFVSGIHGVTPVTPTRSVVINANGELGTLGALANGELIIGSNGVSPLTSTLTGGNNIGITNGAGSITVDVNGTTQYAVQVGDATGSLDSLAVGATNQVLLGNTGANASWGQVDLTTDVTGILPVPNGGTGVSTLTDGGLMIGSGAGAVTSLAQAANGELPIGSVGVDPVLATLTAGSDIGIANGAGSITISYTGSVGIAWSEVTGTSQAAAVDTGYITNNAGQVTVTLPDTAALGSIIRICGKGAGGWKVAQNAGETIIWDESTATTTGAGGYLESTDDYDAIELLCTVADTDWTVLTSKGNITLA